MRRNKSYLFLSLLIWSQVAYSQFGNEWIDYSQSYFKIKVTQNGFYRVTAAELEAKGFPTASVPANRIQLFRRGEEVAVQVNSTAGVLNYLEFYGERNKGVGDKALYTDPAGAPPHEYYNLFTDTSAYFLTWKLTAETGKRMSISALNDFTGLTPQTFHLNPILQLETSTYAPGLLFGSGSEYGLSDYDFGEGWTGNFVSKGGNKQFNFTLNNLTTGSDPTLEIVLIGGNTLSHNVDVLVGPDQSSLRTIGNIQFADRNFKRVTLPFLSSDINASGNLSVRINTVGFDGAADRVSTAMIRVVYPQSMTMLANENKTFHLQALGTSEKAYLRVTTTNAAGSQVYDITNELNPIRITTTNYSDRLEAIIPGPEIDRVVHVLTTPLSVADIDAINFINPSVSGIDYFIVTHPALRIPASNGLDPIQAYLDYRASISGGSYSGIALNIFDVFNEFNYGDASPLAIFLFLIGKGRLPSLNFYRNNDHTIVNIPTYGQPGGDLMYTKALGASPFKPAFPVGRLNAYNSEQVKGYLDKVKSMESLGYTELFRKDVLQLSGGKTTSELDVFRAYIEDFRSVLEGDFLGGRAINVNKETSEVVQVIDVVEEINNGVGLITLFGHSSSTVNDIEIGRVSSGEFGYANQGKYPFILVNGCNAGSIFATSISFVEDWVITPNLGAIGFIAHSEQASSINLKRYSDLFYANTFAQESSFGSTLGEIFQACSDQYFDTYGTGQISQTQVLQMILHGDPLVKVFGATQPDYEIAAERTWVEGYDNELLLASQDSFKVNMIIRNYGRTVTDSLLVRIDRTLPQGEIVQTYQKFLRPLREDTLVFKLFNESGQQVVGTNAISIYLDPGNETPELNEGNNFLGTTFEIFQGNTSHLYPPNFSIYSSSSIQFHWQPTDIFQEERSYDIQIDTTSQFNSAFLKSSSITGTRLLSENFDFAGDNLPDSTVIFWRTRFTSPASEFEEVWEQTSFTIIDASTPGWGQFSSSQFVENKLVGLEYKDDPKHWQFIETNGPVSVMTFGANHPSFLYDDLKVLANGIDYLVTSNTIDPECANNTINALVFDRESTNPYRPIPITGDDVFNTLVCGRLPQMVYNFSETNVIGANAYLETLITNAATGDYVMLFNIGQVNYSNWDADVLTALNLIGVSNASIASLINGQPVIILGRKGDAPGNAIVISNDGSATPVTQQSITLDENIFGTFTSGRVVSDRIGPAKNWNSFTYQLQEGIEDVAEVTVLGVTLDGNEVDLFQFARRDDQDLSGIDATMYPWIKLDFYLEDGTNLTPPQLDFWQVLYERPPEGMLFTDDLDTEQLVEGELATKNFSFYNLSTVDFTDSANVRAVLRGVSNSRQQDQNFKIKGPLSGDTTLFVTAIPTINQGGTNNMTVEVRAAEAEEYLFNNDITLSEAVNVDADETNPVLDVTFDGAYIMNGDIVSSDPTIVIRLKDDNSFILKSDTVGMELKLKRPCEGCIYERVNLGGPFVNYTPASSLADFEITYTPGSLEDGIYSLSIQGRDESGNNAGTAPYEISFEVVTEASITHFYPYPNPFSTNTRFVFTLTGSELPEKIKIQIMTISGRIVREINQDEIGPIKIGHNITEYAWDGTDEFGDQLANGVYFYRVVMRSSTPLEHRETSADGAFKNGFGKLYILR